MDFELVEKHPWLTTGIIGVGAMLLYLYWRKSSTTTTAAVDPYAGGYPYASTTDPNATAAANAQALAQIQANSQTTAYSAQLQGLQIQTAGQVQIAGMDQATQLRVAELSAGTHVGDTSAALAAQLATINAQLQLGAGSQQTQVDLAKVGASVQLASIDAISKAYQQNAPAASAPNNIVINIPSQTWPNPTAPAPTIPTAPMQPPASATNPSPTAINPGPAIPGAGAIPNPLYPNPNTSCPAPQILFQGGCYGPCNFNANGAPAPGSIGSVAPSYCGGSATSGTGRGRPATGGRGVSLAFTGQSAGPDSAHTAMANNILTLAATPTAAPAVNLPTPIGLGAGACGFDAACIERNRLYYAQAEDQRIATEAQGHLAWCLQDGGYSVAGCQSTYGPTSAAQRNAPVLHGV